MGAIHAFNDQTMEKITAAQRARLECAIRAILPIGPADNRSLTNASDLAIVAIARRVMPASVVVAVTAGLPADLTVARAYHAAAVAERDAQAAAHHAARLQQAAHAAAMAAGRAAAVADWSDAPSTASTAASTAAQPDNGNSYQWSRERRLNPLFGD